MRTDWVAKRKNDKIRTQMHYARKGIITEEMYHIARREALLRSWFAPKWPAAE